MSRAPRFTQGLHFYHVITDYNNGVAILLWLRVGSWRRGATFLGSTRGYLPRFSAQAGASRVHLTMTSDAFSRRLRIVISALRVSRRPLRLLLLLALRGCPPSVSQGAQGDCLFVQQRLHDSGSDAWREAYSRRRDPRRIVAANSRHLGLKLRRHVRRFARASVGRDVVWISYAGTCGLHTVLSCCTIIRRRGWIGLTPFLPIRFAHFRQ